MSDILAIFFILLSLGIAYPGLLVTVQLLFPNIVRANQQRLAQHPWRCLWTGMAAALLLSLPVLALVNSAVSLMQFIGWAILALGLALSAFGAAGLAGLMAARLSGSDTPPLGAYARAAVALELAAAFPLLGWLLFFPLSVLATLGAAVWSALRRPAVPVVAAPALKEAAAEL
jgi:hypothetical protein